MFVFIFSLTGGLFGDFLSLPLGPVVSICVYIHVCDFPFLHPRTLNGDIKFVVYNHLQEAVHKYSTLIGNSVGGLLISSKFNNASGKFRVIINSSWSQNAKKASPWNISQYMVWVRKYWWQHGIKNVIRLHSLSLFKKNQPVKTFFSSTKKINIKKTTS